MRPAGAAAQKRQDGLGAPATRRARFVSSASRTWSRSASTPCCHGVVEDRCVVDEHVESAQVRASQSAKRARSRIGDVERLRRHVEAPVDQPRGGRLATAPVTARQHDGHSALGELAAHLQADTAIGAGDERDPVRISRREGRPCRRCGGRGARGWPRRARASSPRGRCAGPVARGDEGQQARRAAGRAAALGELGEDEQAVAASRRARGRTASASGTRCALGSLLAKETTVPSAAHALQRGAERRAADALDDHVELRPLGRQLVKDLVDAELGEAAGALGAGRDGGHVRARQMGEPDGEPADAAAGAGHEHAAAEHVAGDVEGEQRRDPRHGERGGLGEAHLVGQDGDGVGRAPRRAAPTPGCEGDDARALRRAAAVGGRPAARRPRSPSRSGCRAAWWAAP